MPTLHRLTPACPGADTPGQAFSSGRVIHDEHGNRRARLDAYPADDPSDTLRQAIDSYADFLTGPAYAAITSIDPRDPTQDDQPGDVWRDLRPSEAAVLDAIADEAKGRAFERAEAIIIDELVAAALRFAAAYPDAPRAKVPVSAG